MRKIFLLAILFSGLPLMANADNGLASARELAKQGIIVDQSTVASFSGSSLTLDDRETALYHLGDILIRQDAMNVALKLRGSGVTVRTTCQKYFSDVVDGLPCRNIESAADQGIVSRLNRKFRPHDSLTLAESLIILFRSLQIPMTDTDSSGISGDQPEWQKDMILTLREMNLGFTITDVKGNIVLSFSNTDDLHAPIDINLSHRVTRGQFFELTRAFLHRNDDPVAHCTVYNDGCNDCSVTENGTPACTKRACFWQGIPSCSQCEAGYHIADKRCVRDDDFCVREGGYAGGGHVIGPEDPNDFLCCPGLTRAERADGTTFADAGYTCIREGDKVCNSEFESDYNSSDCRTTTAFDSSICQTYFDGCNTCSNGPNGAVCTLKFCATPSPAYCTSYKSYDPKTESEDSAFLGKVTSEVRSYASNLSCSSSDQCQWAMIGAKACGGPSGSVAYSTKNVDANVFNSKVGYITDVEKAFNVRYNIMSDCSMMMPPAAMSCVSNLCH